MILYLTTTHADVATGVLAGCPQRICRLKGHTEPHLCFTSEPLSGLGPYVHTVDLPESALTRLAYQHEFRSEAAVVFYAIPLTMLQRAEVKSTTYEQVTGRPWNEFVFTVLDKRESRESKERRLGQWAVLWASRRGLATAEIARRSPVAGTYLSVKVTLSTDFHPETDYLVLENHEEFEKEMGPGTKETWKLTTPAGATPQWAIFPQAWQEWVWNRKVGKSAVDYILQHAPWVSDEVKFASARDSKHNKARAWRQVADAIGRRMQIDLGTFAGHSWTAVQAMPMRIAERLGQNLPYVGDEWAMPVPKPEYVNPDESGRYCLANLYGPYPTHGPGVDHAPQVRAYTGREGELAPNAARDDFSCGHGVPALAMTGA